MEINRSNFQKNLSEILLALDKCSFVSLDLQLTGTGHCKKLCGTSPDERYKTICEEVKEYGILELGLSIFCHETKTSYLNSSYNFPVSGNDKATNKYDIAYCSLLVEQGFDFNRSFKEGLSFLPMLEAKICRTKAEGNLVDNIIPMPLKTKEAEEFLATAISKINECKDKGERCIFLNKEMKPLYFSLLKKNVAMEFPNSVFNNCDGYERNIEVLHFETLEQKLQFRKEEKEKELQNIIGLGNIITKIIEVQKPIIGHNAWLNVLHLVDKFLMPLPETFSEFKTILTEVLPPIVDTEYIAMEESLSQMFSDFRLLTVFHRTLEEPFGSISITADAGSRSYSCDLFETKLNNCGYNAYMSGKCFLEMFNHLGGVEVCDQNLVETSLFKNMEKDHIIEAFDYTPVNLEYAYVPDLNALYAKDVVSESSSVTEINRSNFDSRFEEIVKCVEEADFISYDFEFTGLGQKGQNKCMELDTPGQRYKKARESVRQYSAIQVGISTFKKVHKSYHNSTYSFHLKRNSTDLISYDVAALKFLVTHNFDFNKYFKEGLPCVGIKDKMSLKSLNLLCEESSATLKLPMSRQQEKDFVAQAIANVKKSQTKGEKYVFKFEDTNPSYFDLILANVAMEFPNSYFREYGLDIEVLHFDSLDKKKEFLREEKERCIKRMKGFGRLIEKIVECKKPLVGHNMWLDLLYFIETFIMPLPEEFDEFQSLIKNNIPTIYDTKLLSKDTALRNVITSTVLKSLHEQVTKEPFKPVNITKIQESDCHKDVAHDAGYDAYMTGVCFVSLIQHLDKQNTEVKSCKPLELFVNKCNFMRSHDMDFIELHDEQDVPARSYIYDVICPQSFNSDNVRELFQPRLETYKVIWVNETKLYVVPTNPVTVGDSKIESAIIASAPPLVQIRMCVDGPKKSGKASSKRKSVTNNVAKPSKKRKKNVVAKTVTPEVATNCKEEKTPTFTSHNAGSLPTLLALIGALILTLGSLVLVEIFKVPDEW